MNLQKKSISDTSLVHLPQRKRLYTEIQKYLSSYDIYVRYMKNTNNIQLQQGLLSMQNILLSNDKVYIYEHSQIIIGYYCNLDTFIKKFRGDAFFENGRENMILCIEKDSDLYRHCLQNYDYFFNSEYCGSPDIKLFIKLFRMSEEDLFLVLDF
jgi:hypothetical protein